MRDGGPFRPYFLLAILGGLAGVGLWVPELIGVPVGAGVRHGDLLLFGMLPAVMAGFLRTALPRWTRRELRHPWAWTALLPLWPAGAAASVWLPPAMRIAGTLALMALAVLTAGHLASSGDRRNRSVAVLLGVLAIAAGRSALGGEGLAGSPSGRALLAAVLGLLMLLGGRIVPSVTASCLGLPDRSGLYPYRPRLEAAAAVLAAGALASWVASPDAPGTAVAAVAAAVCQTLRLLQWRGWRVAGVAAVAVLHHAYAAIPAGFAALAAPILLPAGFAAGAALHIWTVGAVGLMSIGVMASMIRKHSGRALRHSPAASGCCALALAAAILRAGAGVSGDARTDWLLAAAAAWMAALLLFLYGFGPMLLKTRRPAP